MSWGKLGWAVYEKWTDAEVGRKLFPKRFAKRDAKRAARRREIEELAAAAGGEYLVDTEDTVSILDKLGELRTSTKQGAAGIGALGAMALMTLPYAEEVEALVQQACQSENGAVPFLVGGGFVWLVSYVTARKSKTPANPGKL